MYLPKLDNVVRKWMLQTGVRRHERKLDRIRHTSLPPTEHEAWLVERERSGVERELSAVLIQTWWRGVSARRSAAKRAARLD